MPVSVTFPAVSGLCMVKKRVNNVNQSVCSIVQLFVKFV